MSKSSQYFCAMMSLLFSIPAFADRKEHTQIITENEHTYKIEVEGFRGPVNETIIIENLGDKPIINPRVTVNGIPAKKPARAFWLFPHRFPSAH